MIRKIRKNNPFFIFNKKYRRFGSTFYRMPNGLLQNRRFGSTFSKVDFIHIKIGLSQQISLLIPVFASTYQGTPCHILSRLFSLIQH